MNTGGAATLLIDDVSMSHDDVSKRKGVKETVKEEGMKDVWEAKRRERKAKGRQGKGREGNRIEAQ